MLNSSDCVNLVVIHILSPQGLLNQCFEVHVKSSKIEWLCLQTLVFQIFSGIFYQIRNIYKQHAVIFYNKAKNCVFSF